jgi:hypothetical protein
MTRWYWLACVIGCSFEHGHLAQDDPDGPTSDAGSVSSDARRVDASGPVVSSTNLLAATSGAVMVSFTSEYCTPVNTPMNCEPGWWNHFNVHDGVYASSNTTSTEYKAVWSSESKTTAAPEEFVFSFGGAQATIERIVVQNWRGAGMVTLYSTHFVLYGDFGDGTWTMLLDQNLATTETPQPFPLTSPTKVVRLRFAITSGVDPRWWTLGELEAWGRMN